MTKFVLDGNELESTKAEAKSKIIDEIGFGVSISGNTIEVKYSVDIAKVAHILNSMGVSYSGA